MVPIPNRTRKYLSRRSPYNDSYRNKTYERCQEFYVQARATLLGRQEDLEVSNPHSRSSDALPTIVTFSHRNALPRISLPQFSGDYPSWRSFHLFSSMVVNNSELMDVERMQYLKFCLSGEAARLVINLSVSGDSFAIAWETLIVRYENKRLLISSQLDKLYSIKLFKTKSARSLSFLLATITESLGALCALGCATDQWDPILLHQLVRLLDSETREAWEFMLSSSTSYLKFSKFKNFLIGRIRTLESLESFFSFNPSQWKDRSFRFPLKTDLHARSLTAATSKTADGMTCHFCGSSHFPSSCPDYSTFSVQ